MRSLIFAIIFHLISCSGPYWEGRRVKKLPINSDSIEIDFSEIAFSEHCKESKSPEVKKTIEALLEVVGEKDCEIAEIELKKVGAIDLSGKALQNLVPLTGFKNIKRLYLDQNQLTEINILGGLENLELLSLRENQISDISPLSELVQLRWLFIGKNPIEDELPLTKFPVLQTAWLGSDVEPKILQFNGANDETLLEELSSVCQAGYQYYEFNSCRSSSHPPESYIEMQSPHCGIQSKTPVYKSCRVAANGIEVQARKESKTFSIFNIREDQIAEFRGRLKRQCDAYTESFRTTEVDVQMTPRERISNTGDLGRLRDFNYDCQVSIALYRSSPHLECGLDHEDIIYNMCAHAEHGVKEYKAMATAACGISDRLVQSKANLERVEVELLGQVGKCLSCDDLPSESKEEATKLGQCLVEASHSIGPELILEPMKFFEQRHLSKLAENEALDFVKILDFSTFTTNL